MLTAALVIGGAGEALSAPKKKRVRTPAAPITQGFNVPVDADGVPIIMKGYRSPPRPRIQEPEQRADRRVRIPRGSSTYIPPPVPSPTAGPTPQEILGSRTVQPYNPPPINSFGDRVIDAIHAFPLQRGLGNNPNDLQQFIRQRANQ